MNTTPVKVQLPASSVTVSISIRVADIPRHAVVPIRDERGNTQAQPDVVLTIPYREGDRGSVTARIKGRAFRRLVNEIDQYANPADKITLTGRLNSRGEIEAAGFKPFAKESGFDDRNLVA